MARALQAKMGDEGSNHENGDAQSTKADDFQIVIEQHDGKGEFLDAHKIAQPLGQVEGLELALDVAVAHNPNEEDGSKHENGKNFLEI